MRVERSERTVRPPGMVSAAPEQTLPAPFESRRRTTAPASEKPVEARPPRPVRERPARSDSDEAPAKLEKYRVEVGHRHGMKPGNLVGAVANEAGLDSRYIGRIEIEDDHSFIELPEGMPKEIFQHLKKVYVAGQPLRLGKVDPQRHRRRIERGGTGEQDGSDRRITLRERAHARTVQRLRCLGCCRHRRGLSRSEWRGRPARCRRSGNRHRARPS